MESSTKTAKLTVRVEKAFLPKLKEAADSTQQTVADWIREVLNTAADVYIND